MTKAAEYCATHDPIAVYSDGAYVTVELYGFEYDDAGNQRVYIRHTIGSKSKCHLVRIQHNAVRGDAYFQVNQYRIRLDDCIKV